jgi:predicted PurR-regulated permease PerM
MAGDGLERTLRLRFAMPKRPQRAVADADDGDLLKLAESEPEPDQGSPDDKVSFIVKVWAAWSWRLLVILILGVAVLYGVAWVCSTFSTVVMPLLTALLFTAALEPLNRFLVRHNWPKWLASAMCLLTLVVVVGGLLTLVGAQIASQWDELSEQAQAGFQQLMDWLASGPLHLDQARIDSFMDQVLDLMQTQASNIASGLASAGGAIGGFVIGFIMCLFALFFFLKDGRRFARSAMLVIPRGPRAAIAPALVHGWTYMVNYVRAAVAVAAVDATGAGLGALLLGSNLWVAIMALTFVTAFVPMLGAMLAGGVAVLVVLATLGWVKAVIMLAVFVVVCESEVHILQPFLLGRAVEIHPLVVLVSIAVGMVIAGIAGGVFAIPLVAMANGILREVTGADEVSAE